MYQEGKEKGIPGKIISVGNGISVGISLQKNQRKFNLVGYPAGVVWLEMLAWTT